MDLLVKLYDRPASAPALRALKRQGVSVRRALAPEKRRLVAWVRELFGERWASECEISFGRRPVAVFIAVRRGRPVGFACTEAMARGFFGPTGVELPERGAGVGTALLLLALDDLAARGHAYGIIGGAGPAKFYKRAVGAIPIPGSTPGPYNGLLT